MPTPEDKACEKIDQALLKVSWQIQDIKEVNLNAGHGIALRNFPLISGHGYADYLLYVDGKAAGVIEAKICRSILASLYPAIRSRRCGGKRARHGRR
jgi:type I restriction enzyme, R subunit